MSRITISPFKHGHTWWARFPVKQGNGKQRTLGTNDRDTAVNLCAMLVTLRAQKNWFVLERLAAGTLSLTDTYSAYIEKRLDAYIEQLLAGPASIDLEPYVERWLRQMEKAQRPGAATRAIYVRQVRTLLPADTKDERTGKVVHHEFPSSALTKKRVVAWLESLEDVEVTNRYRAALSAFCKYLVNHVPEYVPENVARKVDSQPMRPPRTNYLSHTKAKELISAIRDPEARAWSALAIATGMERCAIMKLCHQDVNTAEYAVHAHGSKRKHRDRPTTVPRFFDWAWEIFLAWYKPGASEERVFSVHPNFAYRQMKDACERTGVVDFVMHDWRHCFAVCALQAGLEPVAIARQLGHKNTQQLWDTYGQYWPNSTAMRPPVPSSARAVAARMMPKAKKASRRKK